MYGTRTRGLRRDRQRTGCGSEWQLFATVRNAWKSLREKHRLLSRFRRTFQAASYTLGYSRFARKRSCGRGFFRCGRRPVSSESPPRPFTSSAPKEGSSTFGSRMPSAFRRRRFDATDDAKANSCDSTPNVGLPRRRSPVEPGVPHQVSREPSSPQNLPGGRARFLVLRDEHGISAPHSSASSKRPRLRARRRAE